MHSVWKKPILMAIFLIVLGFVLQMMGCSTNSSLVHWRGLGKFEDKSDLSGFIANIRPTPGNPDSHYLVGRHFQGRGRHREAIQELKKVLSIDPSHIKAYNGLGISYDFLGKFPDAIEAYQAALRLDPTLDYVYNNLGYSLFLQGDLERSIATFQKAISLNNREPRFHNNLAMAYCEKGQFDLALAEFVLAGDEAKGYFNLAQIYFRKGMYDEAKLNYARAMVLDPSFTIARTGMEATNALRSIFKRGTRKVEAEGFIAPERTAKRETLPQEIKNPIHPELTEEEPAGIAGQKVGNIITVTREFDSKTSLTSPARKEGPKEAGNSKESAPKETKAEKGGMLPSPPVLFPNSMKSQDHQIEKGGLFYEVQVACFQSRQNAIFQAYHLRKKGFQASIRNWTDKRGIEWFLLAVGPFMSKEEALTCKGKIEQEKRFKDTLIHVRNMESNRLDLEVQNQAGQIKPWDLFNKAGIEISNGNGVNGMAGRIGHFLKYKGLKVVRLTNADNFSHAKTSIFYQRGYFEAADRVARHLPVNGKLEELQKMDRSNINIKVVIGKDLISQGNFFKDRQG